MTPVPEAVGRYMRRFQADPSSVRAGLLAMLAAPPLATLSPDRLATIETVLAEVLNNICEHAYSGLGGEIEVSLRLERGALCCVVTDGGAGMPEGLLPPGSLPHMGGTPPEGGFGWHLIRQLASDLRYERVDGRNQLRFLVRG